MLILLLPYAKRVSETSSYRKNGSFLSDAIFIEGYGFFKNYPILA